MALGVFVTFRLLDIADLTVDGSFATGGAVTVMLLLAGWPAWAALLAAILAGVLTGLCTGWLHTKLGIPAILAGILTQFSLLIHHLIIIQFPRDRYPCFRYLRNQIQIASYLIQTFVFTKDLSWKFFCRLRKLFSNLFFCILLFRNLNLYLLFPLACLHLDVFCLFSFSLSFSFQNPVSIFILC